MTCAERKKSIVVDAITKHLFSPSTAAEEASPSPSGLCWTDEWKPCGKKELRLGALKSRRATPLLSFPRFQAGCLSGWWRGVGGGDGDGGDFVNHEHKSLLLPLRSSPPPPPAPPLPECLGLSGLLCTQIVLVRWEFIMWCGGREQRSPVQLTGCARPRQAEGEKSTLGAKHHYKPNLNHPPSAV